MVKIVKANSAEALENKVNQWLKHFKKVRVVGYGIAINQSEDNYRNNTKCYNIVAKTHMLAYGMKATYIFCLSFA